MFFELWIVVKGGGCSIIYSESIYVHIYISVYLRWSGTIIPMMEKKYSDWFL